MRGAQVWAMILIFSESESSIHCVQSYRARADCLQGGDNMVDFDTFEPLLFSQNQRRNRQNHKKKTISSHLFVEFFFFFFYRSWLRWFPEAIK